MDLETIRQEARAVAEELITTAQMKPGQVLVVGCSSSEIHNSKLGTDSSQEIGQAVFEALYEAGINIQMINTSEIRVSVLLDEGDVDRAVRAIHAKFFDEI